MIYQELGIFVIALIILIKCSNWFVEYASKIAKRLGVTELVIGLTLVSIGTSLPELSSSIIAALEGNTELVVGNVVGSNIANIGLILAITIIYSALKIKPNIYKKEFGLLISISLMFFAFALDGTITSIEGMIMLIIMFLYLLSLLRYKVELGKIFKLQSYTNLIVHIRGILRLKEADGQQKVSIKKVAKESVKAQYEKEAKTRIREYFFFDIAIVIVSGIFIVLSAKYVVGSATALAMILGVGSNVIGLTLFAIGTSLPELSVSIAAVQKKLNGLVVGNIIGSNIANILMVAGMSAIVAPLHILKFSLIYSIPIMMAMSLLLLTFARSGWELSRKEGFILLGFYILFLLGTIYTATVFSFFTLINGG